jgi:ABC-2 type transport system permease protein
VTAPGLPARILEQGYVRYDGPRGGVVSAMRSVMARTAERALGIRRRGGAKVLPILAALLAYIPAVVFVGISVFTKDQPFRTNLQLLPTYGQYYGFVWGAILVFTAFVVPGVLCTDQRNGMFGMYLASPLNRTTYLISKAGAVFSVLALSTIGPLLLLLVAYSLNDAGPDGFGGFLSVLGRIALSGTVLTLFYLGFAFAVSSTTTRWSAASATIIVTFFATTVLTGVLIRRGRVTPQLFLLDFTQLPMEFVLRIFGEYDHTSRYAGNVSTPAIGAAITGWICLFAAFTWLQYRRIEVTR